MNRGVQLALVMMAAIALPAPSRAGDTETIAKRAALFTPRRRAEGFRSMDTAYPYHGIKRGGAIAELPRALRKLDVTYLPELKGSGYDGVPIRDILEMSLS